MLSSVEFLAEHRYDSVTISAPSNLSLDPRWIATININGSTYSGLGDNGHQALVAAIKRFRDTDPDTLPNITLTISADREWNDGEA